MSSQDNKEGSYMGGNPWNPFFTVLFSIISLHSFMPISVLCVLQFVYTEDIAKSCCGGGNELKRCLLNSNIGSIMDIKG